MQQQHRIQPGSVLDERGPHVIAGCIMLDQSVTGRGRRAVTLEGAASVPGLVGQLERGLEEVHVQEQRPVEMRHGLTGDLTGVTVMADEAAHHISVLLLDPGLIVAVVCSGPGELDES